MAQRTKLNVKQLFNNDSIKKQYSKDQIEYWIEYTQYWQAEALKLATQIVDHYNRISENMHMHENQSHLFYLRSIENQFVHYMDNLTSYFNTVDKNETGHKILAWAQTPVLNAPRHYLYLDQDYSPQFDLMMSDKATFIKPDPLFL